MTTIAYDGVVLAADGAAFVANIKQPIIKLRKLVLANLSDVAKKRMGLTLLPLDATLCYAFCGDVEKVNEVLSWMRYGGDLPELDQNVVDAGMIVMSGTGRVWVLLPNLTTYETKAPYAAGSGMRYAMGALHAGRSAVDTIEQAIAHTTFAGIGVVTWDSLTDELTSAHTTLKAMIDTQRLNHGV